MTMTQPILAIRIVDGVLYVSARLNEAHVHTQPLAHLYATMVIADQAEREAVTIAAVEALRNISGSGA